MRGEASPDAKRVLVTSDYVPPSDGGVEQVVQKLALHLTAAGYEVGVFTLDDGDRTFELRENPDVSVYTASAVDLTDAIGLQSMLSASALREFGRVVEEFRPDVVHAHNRFFFTSALAAGYSRYADSEFDLVTTVHLGEIDMISGVGGVAARAFEQTVGRFIVSQSDRVVCVSRAAAEAVRPLGATSTTVIRNSVDTDEFSPARTDEKSLLYIGRFVRNNGILDLLAALPEVVDAHPDATVHLVGSGPLEDAIRERIRATGLSDSVTVYGYVEDISERYDRASVFCRPSYSEGLPLTMLEAMASGVPPVVTAIAGVPEVVTDGETGVLLEPGDPDGISRAINELFRDPELRHRLGRNAHAYVTQNLTWEQRTERVMTVYP